MKFYLPIFPTTRLKIQGPGEWLISKHGKKQKKWQKLHLVIGVNSQTIIASDLTEQTAGDSTVALDLLKQIDNHKIDRMIADTAYDNFWVYEALDHYNIKSVIPPRGPSILSAKYWEKPTHRDNALMDRCEFGIAKWQKVSSYNKRSLVENSIGRYKRVINNKLYFIKSNNRLTEIKIGLLAAKRNRRNLVHS